MRSEEMEGGKRTKHACLLAFWGANIVPETWSVFEACHRKDITTFLVTNGTTPVALEELDPLPKQLYVSIVAPTEELYQENLRSPYS